MAIDGRQVEIRGGFLDRRYRVADRSVRSEVEAQGHRRELALVVDRQRPDHRGDLGELAQRNLGPGGRCRVDSAERVAPELKARLDLEDHIVFVEGGEDLRRGALSEGVVEERIDHGGVDAQPGSDIAVDLDLQHPAGALLVAGDVGQLRQPLQLLQQNGRPVVELVIVDIDQRILVLGL